ncbi:hypothetical protein [Gimesia chilikensis]|uniref:hypothetical protein n=1 Tax=Gimesia chilikensis TaxID=2605989 RepID=UPI003A933C14
MKEIMIIVVLIAVCFGGCFAYKKQLYKDARGNELKIERLAPELSDRAKEILSMSKETGWKKDKKKVERYNQLMQESLIESRETKLAVMR